MTQQQANERLAALEDNVQQLGRLVRGLPSEDQARSVVKTHRIVSIMFVLLLLVVASCGYFMYRNHEDASYNKQGVQCLLYQFFEHRVTNQAVHDNMATVLNVPPTPHTPLPPRPSPEALQAICRPFLGHGG